MGWTDNAVAAVLGNMQTESSINPGIWEGLSPYTIGGRASGYGLVQWTPWDKYANWAGDDWRDNGVRELQRIDYEAANGLQWFYNAEVGISPPITFRQFTQSTLDVETLSDYWLYFYEHPGDPLYSRTLRRAQSIRWYEFITGHPYTPGAGDFDYIYMIKKKRCKHWRKTL